MGTSWAEKVDLRGAGVQRSRQSRAASVQEGARFAWDADGQGGTFELDGQAVPLRVLRKAA